VKFSGLPRCCLGGAKKVMMKFIHLSMMS